MIDNIGNISVSNLNSSFDVSSLTSSSSDFKNALKDIVRSRVDIIEDMSDNDNKVTINGKQYDMGSTAATMAITTQTDLLDQKWNVLSEMLKSIVNRDKELGNIGR